MVCRFLLLLTILVLVIVPTTRTTAESAIHLTWVAGQPTLIPVMLLGDPVLAIDDLMTQSAPTARSSERAVLPHRVAWIERTAILRGQRYAVIRIAPSIQAQGRMQRVERLTITITHAQVVTTPLASSGPFGAPVLPTNPLAASSGLVAHVTTPGMQEIAAADLATHGLALPLTSAALHLWVGGAELALDIRDGDDGRLDAGDTLRFWMPHVGDRWNTITQVWLSVDGTQPGRRMGARTAVTASTAPLRTVALGSVAWRDPRVYESRLAGPSGDHWGSVQLRGVAGAPAPVTSILLTLPQALASAPITVTLTGMSVQTGTHHLQVAAGAAATPVEWAGRGNWQQTATLPTAAAALTLTLDPGITGDDLIVDTVQITTTMRLNDLQARSTTWRGVGGRWRYALGNLPSARTLYDLSDPGQPVMITFPAGRTVVLEEDGARPYTLVADSDLQHPAVARYVPQPLPSAGTALVIAPQAFLGSLAPLATAHTGQGQPLTLVAVEALYDRWSWGQVDPAAIRSFLRHAAATWLAAPTSVLLVGDGTSDPHDYLGFHNPTLIPPYLAMVDPWIGETSCDTCYAQLDGDDALDDALPDLAVGRLPVRTITEVERLVDKLIRYEAMPYGAWQGRVVSVADNTRTAQGTPETVNDFAGMAADSEDWFPVGTRVQRIFYDPDPATSGQPGHESDARQAYQRTVAAIRGGAAVIQYIGHGSYWQWAYTAPTSTPSHLFGIQDAETLTSVAGLPVVLEMTCATSTIQLPSVRGSTIDEALVLNPTGAIATWGSSGLGVAYGHQHLHQGFIRALTQGDRDLGTLTMAGIWELWSVGQCCTDAIRSYHLLGDPLTQMQFQVGHQVALPLLVR